MERLDREGVGWVTKVTAGGQQQSTPVWFVVRHDAVNLQSQPHAPKVANVRANRKTPIRITPRRIRVY